MIEDLAGTLGVTDGDPDDATRMLDLLAMLDRFDDRGIDQLTHVLQTATRAERAGADPDVIVGALCHDVGKVASLRNHAAISAEMLRPYVRDGVYRMVRTHHDFMRLHHGGNDLRPRQRHRRAPWYDLAATFADEWDDLSFDPGYDTWPLEHFEPVVNAVFARPLPGRRRRPPGWRTRLRVPARRFRRACRRVLS